MARFLGVATTGMTAGGCSTGDEVATTSAAWAVTTADAATTRATPVATAWKLGCRLTRRERERREHHGHDQGPHVAEPVNEVEEQHEHRMRDGEEIVAQPLLQERPRTRERHLRRVLRDPQLRPGLLVRPLFDEHHPQDRGLRRRHVFDGGHHLLHRLLQLHRALGRDIRRFGHVGVPVVRLEHPLVTLRVAVRVTLHVAGDGQEPGSHAVRVRHVVREVAIRLEVHALELVLCGVAGVRIIVAHDDAPDLWAQSEEFGKTIEDGHRRSRRSHVQINAGLSAR